MEIILGSLLYTPVFFVLVNSSCESFYKRTNDGSQEPSVGYIHSQPRVDDWRKVVINTCPSAGRVKALEFSFVSNGSSGSCVETLSLHTKELVYMRIDMSLFDIITCESVSNHADCGTAFGSVSIPNSGMTTIEFETPANNTLHTPEDKETYFFGRSFGMEVRCGMETIANGYENDFKLTFVKEIATTYITSFLSTLTTMTETQGKKTQNAAGVTAMTYSHLVEFNISLKSTFETTNEAPPSHIRTRYQYATTNSFFDDPVHTAVVSLVCGASGLAFCGIIVYYMKNRICKGVMMVAGTAIDSEEDRNDCQSIGKRNLRQRNEKITVSTEI